jgi:RNA-directed DNA polymerase
MSTASTSQGKAMYVASKLDREWLLNEQRKLYERSFENPNYIFRKLWGLITDPRNLRMAFSKVARNKGRRTAGVDGVTVRAILATLGAEAFVANARAELRSGAYRPSPVRRVSIPKPGKPGEFRALGIPTVTDRVVQAALKNILEPIFEADFYPCSYGFRPGKGAHAALEHLRMLLRPREVRKDEEIVRRLPYQWAIEGDIKGCFDHISHHGLLTRVRRRIGDNKVNRLVLAFLKAGVLSEDQFLRTDSGTPQGGILSPLLANIALSAIEERYERHVWPKTTPTVLTDEKAITTRGAWRRGTDRKRGLPIFFPVRYADDFIILVSVPPGPKQQERAQEAAMVEKENLASYLKENLNLELSEKKTLVTSVTNRLRFLGHHVCVRLHPFNGRLVSTAVIPKDRSQLMRQRIKDCLGRNTINTNLEDRLKQINPVLRGWGYFYRHAWGASHVFASLNSYLWWSILRWLKKKHPKASMKFLIARYGWRKPGGRAIRWRDGQVVAYDIQTISVHHFKLGWLKTPDFASKSTESPVRIERRTPGSERGMRKPVRGDDHE